MQFVYIEMQCSVSDEMINSDHAILVCVCGILFTITIRQITESWVSVNVSQLCDVESSVYPT